MKLASYNTILIIMLWITCCAAKATQLPTSLQGKEVDWDTNQTQQAMQQLMKNGLGDSAILDLPTQIALWSLSQQHEQVVKAIAELDDEQLVLRLLHLAWLSQSNLATASCQQDFKSALKQLVKQKLQESNDQQLEQIGWHQGYDLSQGQAYLDELLATVQDQGSPQPGELKRLLVEYQRYRAYSFIKPTLNQVFKQELARRYIIDKDVLITTSAGVVLSALVVRKREVDGPQATALMSNIYTNEQRNMWTAIKAANHGYVGVVADTRGKRLSPEKIVPYEFDGQDTHQVIDWISRQSWSDGQVGMYGGSYSGFVQWAAAPYQHPALKTIVPYVAAIPGQGLPMENNVFITANYAWPFYVTNNKLLDSELYFDNQRWQQLNDKWYQSGRPYQEIDQVDGLPNPWLQKWLDHPAYDAYWQAMVPYKHEFKQINIPVLSVTGYYDDGQISAIHYLKEHEKYNPHANHYLLIGPYDHFGAQGQPASHLRGYDIDPVAQIDVEKITFAWLDHVMKGGPKPAILKDRINYQLMGSNQWIHVSSMQRLNQIKQRFYLSSQKKGAQNNLSQSPETAVKFLTQVVDLSDRKSSHNQYYPWPIIKPQLDVPNGLVFMTDELQEDQQFSGTISGELTVKANKQDFDFGVVLYELLPDGQTFHLGYHLGRASYAKDMSRRQLLIPNKVQIIPFERSRMVSKLIKKGSRIVMLLNVNKNAGAQINYGTGKDVSEESIKDAGEPLKIDWYNSSYIDLPLKAWNSK